MNKPRNAADACCLSCGMNVPAEAVLPTTDEPTRLVPSPDCQRSCEVALTREYGDPAYFAVHRITVATYTLQHPDSVKPHSVAVHLSVLCLAVERGIPPHLIRTPMQRAASLLRRYPPGRLEPPAHRGALNVADIARAGSAEEHCRGVEEWAAAVWAAWQPHHDRVRSWLDDRA